MKVYFTIEIKPYTGKYGEEVWRLVHAHGEGRLTAESIDRLMPLLPTGALPKDVIAFVAVINDEKVVGYSALDDTRSITVVHPGLRGLGIGRAMMREKLTEYFRRRPDKEYYDTLVGASNIPSIKMCLKTGGYLVDAGFHENNGKPWLKFRFDRDKIVVGGMVDVDVGQILHG